MQNRLERFVGKSERQAETVELMSDDDRWRDMFRKVGQQFMPIKWNHYYSRLLLQSGWNIKAPEFLVGLALLMLFGCGAGWSLAGSVGAVVVGVLVFLIGHFMLHRAVEARGKKFTAQLSDALVLIANSLRSGFSFLQAVELVSREMQPPIAQEFARLLNEMNLGASADDALEGLTQRVASMELELVVTAVMIQRQVGGNLAEVLDTIAETIRERARMRREISALTAQGRMSGIVVGLLPFAMAIYMYIFSRDFLMILWMEPLGRAMIAGAVIMQLIGAFVIKKIVTIDV